jgi:hypothetical protein
MLVFETANRVHIALTRHRPVPLIGAAALCATYDRMCPTMTDGREEK